MTRSDESYLKTVDRTLDVLLQFDEQRPEWSSSELAGVTGQHRSVVYRSLVTLERRGFVTRVDGGSRFRLGPKFVELGNVVLSGIDLRQVAHPVMRRLVQDTNESVFLTVVSRDESMCIDKIESSQKVRVTLDVGGRYPLHAGASNKLLLAYLPVETRNELMRRGLPAHTPDTITEPARLERELAAIRKRGWAYSAGELTPSVAAVATPVRSSTGNVVAALSIAGLESRFTHERIDQLLAATRAAAGEISAQLLNWEVPQSTSAVANERPYIRLGVIRVLTMSDEGMLRSHGRMLQQHIDTPDLEVISRCIGGHPEGVSTDADVLTATPRIVSLGREMVRRDRVDALLVSCVADPGVADLRRAVTVPVVGAGSASASVAKALGRPVGALSITDEVLPAVADVLGEQLVAWYKPEAVRTTVDLQSKSDQAALVTAGRRLIEAGAGVVLLACTGFSTLRVASALEEALAVPVIDPVLAAGMVTYYAARGNA